MATAAARSPFSTLPPMAHRRSRKKERTLLTLCVYSPWALIFMFGLCKLLIDTKGTTALPTLAAYFVVGLVALVAFLVTPFLLFAAVRNRRDHSSHAPKLGALPLIWVAGLIAPIIILFVFLMGQGLLG